MAPGTGKDIIVGKTAPIPPDSEELGQRTWTHMRRDVSTPSKSTDSGPGIVNQVLITTNSEGKTIVKVGVRSSRMRVSRKWVICVSARTKGYDWYKLPSGRHTVQWTPHSVHVDKI